MLDPASKLASETVSKRTSSSQWNQAMRTLLRDVGARRPGATSCGQCRLISRGCCRFESAIATVEPFRGYTTGVGNAADPFGQAASNGSQRAVSIDWSSVHPRPAPRIGLMLRTRGHRRPQTRLQNSAEHPGPPVRCPRVSPPSRLLQNPIAAGRISARVISACAATRVGSEHSRRSETA